MHVEAGLISSVYAKTLRLSPAARQEQGSGNVVNLMSNDTSRIKNLFTYLHTLWSGPLQIVVAFTMLWMEIGWPALAGTSLGLCVLPCLTVLFMSLSLFLSLFLFV